MQAFVIGGFWSSL